MDSKLMAKSQIRAVIDVLLNTASDKNSAVSESISTVLRKIAKQHPNDVLIGCCEFYNRNNKTGKEHLSQILKTMAHICEDYIIEIDGDTIMLLIDFCMEIMTNGVNYEPIIQMPASGILVALGSKHCIQVTDALLKKLEVRVVPHYTIPYTLGSLASSNGFEIVPYLKSILEIILPLMAMIKLEHHKYSVAFALGRFSEAINEYMLNIIQAPDPTIAPSMFYVEMNMAYDILSNNWIYSKELKVIESVLLAMSSMFSVLSVEKVNQQTPRAIPMLLSLYKKQKGTFAVTQCLGSVIQVAANVNGTLLEPLLTPMLHSLSDLICIAPDYAQPELLRNHCEVLRCYERLTMHFTDHCLDQIILQLRNNNDKERVKALLILTHLVNSSEKAIQSRVDIFLQILSDMLNDQHIRVKKAVLKAIVAFAYKELLPKQSAQKYLEFIVKLCCKQKLNPKNGEINQEELSDLQITADNTLYMLSTSVIKLDEILWNLILSCFLNSDYSDCCITLLRCLTHLASRRQFSDTCEDIFVRCLALLAQPITQFRGAFILRFLRNIKLCEIETYRSVWDTKISQLIKYLEQNYENFNYKEWEDLIFDFLTLIIQSIKNKKFCEIFVKESKKQLPLYLTKPTEKCLLLKCMALAMCHLRQESLVTEVLNTIIEMVKLNEIQELGACAEAIGICSRSHLKLVLEKLGTIRTDVLAKKSGKLLNFSFMHNQKNEIEVERIRLLVLASYSSICNEAPSDILLQTIQQQILDFAIQELNNCKDFNVRQVCLKTIGSVADVMHPNRNTLHIQMQDRNEVLQLVLSQMQLHNGPEYIELYPIIIPVIISLIRISPALDSEQRMNLLKHCFNNIYNAAAIYCKINAENSLGTYYGDLKMAPFVYTSFSKLNFVVQELIMQSLSPATLDEIVTLLEPWLSRKKAEQRLPAIETLRDALQTYLDNVKFAYEGPTTFTQSGSLLARVVPRCTDSNKNIRKVGVETLRLILCITARYEGHMREHDKVIGQLLEHVQEQIESAEPKLLFNLTTDLAHGIITHLPQIQLPHFINHLMDSLLDLESSSSSGSSVVLNAVVKTKGGELSSHVHDLVNKLLIILEQIQCQRTRSSTLRAVLNFGTYHSKIVVGIILSQPLPYEKHITDCWSVLSTDTNLVCDILEQFKKIFRNCPIYDDNQDLDTLHIVNLQPFQAICAMAELFKNVQLREICKQQFPELFTIFYTTLASYIGSATPATSSRNTNKKEKFSLIPNREAYKLNPINVCLEAFKTYLLCAGYNKVAESLLNVTRLENLNQFLNLSLVLTEAVCTSVSISLAWVITALAAYSKSELEPQRVAVVAFLITTIRHRPNNQNVLTENILEMLLNTQYDNSCLVRQVGLEGLGNAVEYLPWDIISRNCDCILNVFMQGLDYNNISTESAVALEAIRSFSKLLKIEHENLKFLQFCQVTAAMRIKPLFEQEDLLLREAAFRLLGDLASSINEEKRYEAFREQVCGCLITLLLHLSDDSPEVVKSCKYSLRKVSIFFNSVEVNNMIQDHLLEEGILHYTDFITDLIKCMAKDLIDLFPVFLMTCLSYYKSPWTEIRGNAALLTGLLYSYLDDDRRAQVSLDTICYRLLQLLKDENSQVRIQAIQATSYLFVT